MTIRRETAAYVDAIRKCFIDSRLDIPNQCTGLRWGQFLDTNKPGSQTGLYGAIAAAIGLKAGGKARWADAKGAQEELQRYWINRSTIPGADDNLCQNIRLAAFFLGLCFCEDGDNPTIKEVSDHILEHRNPQGDLWAESNVTEKVAVIEESEYASALVLIFTSCGLHFMAANNAMYSCFDAELKKSATALQKKYLNDPGQKRPYLAAMLIAIILVLGAETSRKVRKRFRQDFVFVKSDISARLPHYLDFKRPDGTYGRDYFIAPQELFAPLLLLQPSIRGLEYLHAIRTTEAIKLAVDNTWDKNRGLFAEGVSRPSTVEQGFLVLVLEAYVKKPKHGPRLWPAYIWVHLLRKRESGDRFLAWLIFLCLYMPFALSQSENMLTGQYSEYIPRYLANTIGALSLVPEFWFTAALVAASAIRKPQDVARQVLGMK